MEDKEILKQFKEISNNLMSRCSPDSDIYPLVTALISLFNLVINITQSLKENFVTQTKNFESQINFFKELAQKSEDQAKKSDELAKKSEEENKNLKLMIKELQVQLSNSTITNVKLAYEAINGKGSEKNKPNTETESESTQPEDEDNDGKIFENSSNPDFEKDVNGDGETPKKKKSRGKKIQAT